MSGRPSFTLTLTLKSDGNLEIAGPTNERLLCLGMLEMAKAELNFFHHENAKRIVAPPADPKVLR